MELKTTKLIGNILAWLLGAAMIFFSYSKLAGTEEMLAKFTSWGYQRWFMTVTGSLELLTGVSMFVPRSRKFAAFGVICIMLGAVYTHVVKEGMPGQSTAAAVIILLAGLVIYFNRRLV